MSDNVELLQQRAGKQRVKADMAARIVDLTQARFDASSVAYDEAERERKRLTSAAKVAKRRAHRLAIEAKRATKLARAAKDDRDDAASELDEHVATYDDRRAKLAKAEAAWRLRRPPWRWSNRQRRPSRRRRSRRRRSRRLPRRRPP